MMLIKTLLMIIFIFYSNFKHDFQFSNLSDILIIVSRWYGGIHLGADRFKDYSNAARDLINHLELIPNSVSI